MRRLDHALAGLASRRAPRQSVDLRPLVERLDGLEAIVEGLQDSIDRQARRRDERLNELARRLEPSELARAPSEEARRRGL